MTSDPWPAPRSRAPLDAVVSVPGSKSMTNRALVLAALAAEPTVIEGALTSRDTTLMADGLCALGAGIDVDDDRWMVTPPSALRGEVSVDAGLAGTVMRFLLPVAALCDGPVRIDGDARARERPLLPLVDALRRLGTDVTDAGGGRLPVTVRGVGVLGGGSLAVDGRASSQLVSALLLAAPRFTAGLVLRHRGERLPSTPHVSMTVAMLRSRGVRVDSLGPAAWRVHPGPIAGGTVNVEPDLSSAAAFLAAPLVAGGSVTLRSWPRSSAQPGAATPEVLARMGAAVSSTEAGLVVRGGAELRGIDVDLGDNSELACVLAALAVFASTPSRLTGIGHMRGHETDRLAALAA
ncbi:MAG: 3-phosphoshikimate 1-carboxyvinyltransferase, partial [Frankiales bacterium]|nr:3-phosphoshikimate 1-carboxyvinyltransferase [Frankiales bacterium]